MACYWGQPPIRMTRAQPGCRERVNTTGVRVDHAVGVIYIDRSIPAHFSICDGPHGACLPVAAVRALTTATSTERSR